MVWARGVRSVGNIAERQRSLRPLQVRTGGRKTKGLAPQGGTVQWRVWGPCLIRSGKNSARRVIAQIARLGICHLPKSALWVFNSRGLGCRPCRPRDGQPKRVLLDLKMPRMDGLQVLKQMKQDGALAHHYGSDDDLLTRGERPEHGGVNRYLVKPADIAVSPRQSAISACTGPSPIPFPEDIQ